MDERGRRQSMTLVRLLLCSAKKTTPLLLQVRARTAALHPVLDLVYPAFAALVAFESALLSPSEDSNICWTAQLAKQVRLPLLQIVFARCLNDLQADPSQAPGSASLLLTKLHC